MNCTRSWLISNWKINTETTQAAGYPAACIFNSKPGMVRMSAG
jgi:hypothetical protein